MTFNLLFGGGDEPRFRRILELITRAEPDLLLLQECMDWRPGGPRARRLAEALDLPLEPRHHAFGEARPRGSGRRYHVLAYSRPPLASQRVHADPEVQAHALLELELELGARRLRVLSTHMDAHDEDLRLAEARYLRGLLAPGELEEGHALLVGDLNSLSPRDPYPEDLGERLRRAKVTKYGHPPRREVLPELEDQGWRDALHLAGPPETWVTAPRNRGGVRIDYRTDYVLCSAPLAEALREVRILPLAQDESDHHPVVADFEL